MAGVETGRSRRPLAARSGRRREPAAPGCWRRSWCWSTGRSGCPARSTSTSCGPGSACRRSVRSIRGRQPVEDLPVTRLSRLSLEGLSDDDLISAYYRAAAFAIRPALRKFAAGDRRAAQPRRLGRTAPCLRHAGPNRGRHAAGVGARRSRPPGGGGEEGSRTPRGT